MVKEGSRKALQGRWEKVCNVSASGNVNANGSARARLPLVQNGAWKIRGQKGRNKCVEVGTNVR